MALELRDISKMVDRTVHLHPIDLTLEAGSFNVLCGRTRAGKTSLLRIIAGLDSPSTGAIVWSGENLASVPLRKRPVALVYQEFINYPSLTVFENIASPLRRQKARDIDSRVRELARTLRIDGLLDRLPGQISGGQQQRVAIARALAKGADLLLLDEPLVNLDYKLREELREELHNILASGATTVIYATSDPGEAMALAGNTVVMHEGRVLQSAPALDVYHQPASIATARVFSDPPMNLFTAAVEDGVARVLDDHGESSDNPPFPLAGLGHHLTRLPDGTYCFGVRASDCSLLDPRRSSPASHPFRGSTGPAIQLDGTVELVEITGSETFVHLGCGGVHFVVHEDGVRRHALGEARTLSINPDRLLVFADGENGELVESYR